MNVYFCTKDNKFFIVLSNSVENVRKQLSKIGEYDYLITPMRGMVAEININQTITYNVRA